MARNQCGFCFKFFTNDGNLQAHVKSVHYGEKRRRSAVHFDCEVCGKKLSSNRSYKEHKNTHFQRRPFKCDLCPYAAASQMTLRRHKLRQHVDKSDWNYPCPYCQSIFVDPTSYQSHIENKHIGLSCTFGCPVCQFSTLSSKNFLEHMEKHVRGEIMDFLGLPCDLDETDILPLEQYIVEDDLGQGFQPVQRTYSDKTKIVLGTARGSMQINSQSSSLSPGRKDHGYLASEMSSAPKAVVSHGRQQRNGFKFSYKKVPIFVRKTTRNNVIHCATNFVPEPSIHVEIGSVDRKLGQHNRRVPEEPVMIFNKSDRNEWLEPKDLGKHVLPDGQVDFDLD